MANKYLYRLQSRLCSQCWQMISSESLPLLSKACEFFIYELTRRGWFNTEQQGRRTLQHEDILQVIQEDPNSNLDFLIDQPCPEDKVRIFLSC